MIGLNITATNFNWPGDMTHYRIWDAGAAWCQVHLGPDEYDWSRLDELVDRAKGKHITYVVGGCPRWLAKYPDNPHYAPWLGPGSNSMPSRMADFEQFMKQLVMRYKGRIHAYEIWNEPQLSDFMFPYTDAECNALATMTLNAKSIIKSIDKKALVLAASVLPRRSSGGMRRARKYISALAEKGYPVDAMTCHIYPEVGTGVSRWTRMFMNVVGTMKAMGAPSKLWITETAYGLLGPTINDKTAIDLVHGTYQAAGGRPIYWYALNRPDLGGMQITTDPNSAAWNRIRIDGRI